MDAEDVPSFAHDDAMTLCFHRVPYDHETAAARILAAGLPPEFAQRLHDGR
jgi:diadenosine tetraphosphatase ApaH/serine/threonine PP2A family protein phosphatase